PAPPAGPNMIGRAILERAVVHVPDVAKIVRGWTFKEEEHWRLQALAGAIGLRSGLAVPMLRDGAPLGVIGVGRGAPGAFSDNQIALLQTFADQAVIAIEHVRLFKELEARNRDLTATSEILQVISSSPTDVHPVFEAITQNALKLCGAASSLLTTFDGELLHLAALSNVRPETADFLRRRFPQRPDRGAPGGRAILTGARSE